MRDALALLSELRQLVPPDMGNHALLVVDGKLSVAVRHHRITQMFYLDEADMDRTPQDLAEEIAGIIKRNFAPVKAS